MAKRAREDENSPRQRKRLKFVLNLEVDYMELNAVRRREVSKLIRIHLACARHLRLFSRVSGFEMRWDVDKGKGEEHRNSIFVKNVPRPVMRQQPPFLQEVTSSAIELKDLFLIDELSGGANNLALQCFALEGHWVSLERISLWYLRPSPAFQGDSFPVEYFPVFPHVHDFQLCGLESPDRILGSLVSKLPALKTLILHNRNLKRWGDSGTPIRTDLSSLLLHIPSAENLEGLTVSGFQWDDMADIVERMERFQRLKSFEFEAKDLGSNSTHLSLLLKAITTRTSISDLVVFNIDEESKVTAVASFLEDPDCQLKRLKILQPRTLVPLPVFSRLEQDLTDVLKVNTSLRSLTLNPCCNVELEKLRTFYLDLNRIGRKHIHDPDIPSALWPTILCNQNENPSLMYYLIREKPDLMP
jgi:hypothetical protein